MRYRLALVVVASAAVLIAAACGGTGGTPDTDDVIPAGFDFMLKVRLSDILNDPDVSAIYGAAPKDEDAPQTLEGLLDQFGDDVAIVRQMEDVLVFGTFSDFNDSVGVVARGVFQEEAVLAVMQGRGERSSIDYKGRTIHTFQNQDAAFTLMEDLLVIGSPDIIRRVVDVHQGDAEPASGPVHDAFAAAGDPLLRLACPKMSWRTSTCPSEGRAWLWSSCGTSRPSPWWRIRRGPTSRRPPWWTSAANPRPPTPATPSMPY